MLLFFLLVTVVYDAIVVGSGAAGAWAAKTLTERGLSVALLEAGRNLDEGRDFPRPPRTSDSRMLNRVRDGLLHRQRVQARCTSYTPRTRHFYVDDVEHPYATPRDRPFLWFRGRQLGGRLHTWSRAALRMSDHELRAQSRDGADADWPLRYEELAPYYERVERFYGLHGRRDGLAQLPDGACDPTGVELSPMEERFIERTRGLVPGFVPVANRVLKFHPSRVPTPLAAAQATGRLELYCDAVASRVTLTKDKTRASGVAYLERATSKERELSARVVFLCASAIESVRLLLNSVGPDGERGLGSSSGLLGRYLCDHLMVLLYGEVGGPWKDLPVLRGRPRDDYDFGASGLYFPNFRNLDRRPTDFLRGWGAQCGIGREGHDWYMLAFGEMLPRAENRVTLDPHRKDHLGLPVARIDCTHGENDRRLIRDVQATLASLAKDVGFVLRDDAGASGLWDSLLFRALRSRLFRAPGVFHPGSAIHETGGARMGEDPRRSVLNPQNQLWDAPNVFVTDGACFVSSGSQNHTLTLMALSARAAEHAANELLHKNL